MDILVIVLICICFFVLGPYAEITRNRLAKACDMKKFEFYKKSIFGYKPLFVNDFPNNKEYSKLLIQYRIIIVGIFFIIMVVIMRMNYFSKQLLG